jgi:hypothetical protein
VEEKMDTEKIKKEIEQEERKVIIKTFAELFHKFKRAVDYLNRAQQTKDIRWAAVAQYDITTIAENAYKLKSMGCITTEEYNKIDKIVDELFMDIEKEMEKQERGESVNYSFLSDKAYLLLSDEVEEIAEKLIKRLCFQQGYDVEREAEKLRKAVE